ncbi:hypothetical protein [Nocardia takedensis]|uniref:hypothetical protein n=1 Tax=Nocardia takedensis TaxID=259390 RepID=UPI0002F5412A|nr:hypothetical protein [Nocardia takedensis]
MTVVDINGRLAAAVAVEYLGWEVGQRLTITGDRGSVVTIMRAFDGTALRPRGFLRLPMSVRHRCRIRTGERVLLAASRELDLLIVYPSHTLTAALHRYRPELWDRAS